MDREFALDARGTVTLDASGNGSVVLRPSNAHERWVVTTTVVKTSTATLQPVFTTYVGDSHSGTAVDSTYTGSNDASDTRIEVNEGSYITGVWVGGDVGALATLQLTGKRIQRV